MVEVACRFLKSTSPSQSVSTTVSVVIVATRPISTTALRTAASDRDFVLLSPIISQTLISQLWSPTDSE